MNHFASVFHLSTGIPACQEHQTRLISNPLLSPARLFLDPPKQKKMRRNPRDEAPQALYIKSRRCRCNIKGKLRVLSGFLHIAALFPRGCAHVRSLSLAYTKHSLCDAPFSVEHQTSCYPLLIARWETWWYLEFWFNKPWLHVTACWRFINANITQFFPFPQERNWRVRAEVSSITICCFKFWFQGPSWFWFQWHDHHDFYSILDHPSLPETPRSSSWTIFSPCANALLHGCCQLEKN